MKRTRIFGMALALVDLLFLWWGLTATASDFGSDYAVGPGNRILVLLIGLGIGLVSVVFIAGPGPNRLAGD